MIRKLVAASIIIFVGVLCLSFRVHSVEASGTIYIRADGSIDPPTALVTTVDNVTYTLAGNITSDSDGIVIERNRIILNGAGYTVTGSGVGNGTTLTNRTNVTVRNMTIKNFYNGIYLDYSSNNTLSGNNVLANNGTGIQFFNYSTNNTLLGNNVTANNGYGIWFHRFSDNNTLSGNVMGGNRYNFGVASDIFFHTYLQSVDTSNLVDGKPIYYFVNQSNLVVNAAAYPEIGYLGFVNCANVTVQGLNLTGNGQGLLLAFTNDSKITGNNLANNLDGIFLDYSSNNTLSGNNIANNSYGIVLSSSSDSTLSGNNITATKTYGIYLYSSSNNSVFHNSFVNNTNLQVYAEVSNNTTWDDGYPSGGNYWSDYTGTDLYGGLYQNDTGSDGIGDTSCTIDFPWVGQDDGYPLKGMFADFNATSEHSVQTICNSSITDFQFNGTTIGFNVSGENGTSGFCRICIPTELMNEPFKVFVNGTDTSYNLLLCSNSTHSYLYFNYTHSTEQVIIIPEFPSFKILPFFMVLTMLVVLFLQRKIPRKQKIASDTA